MKRILILGGGTAGSMMANKLVRALPDDWRVTLVDRDDLHVYQPGLLLVPFGTYAPDAIVKKRGNQLDPEVEYLVDRIDRIDPEAKVVALANGAALQWDLLIIATGASTHPERTPGLTGEGWGDHKHEFYSLEGSTRLAAALERFEGGHLVVNPVDMPIKCPVAPLEFTLLADAFLTERGLRSKTEITYVTPLDGAFTKPVASRVLGGLLESRGIRVETEFNTSEVNGALKSYDGREVPYDLLVSIPLHGGSQAIVDSGLGDDLGFVPTHKHTLAALEHPDVFVIGDATNLPSSKAGAVAHFQGDVLYDNVLRCIAGRDLHDGFDGHANCFIETGHGKAMLIDFNYDTEPLPGRFPLPGVGPFTLLEESAVNHWGKLAFKWIYWDFLVAGRELPFEHRMSLTGKWS